MSGYCVYTANRRGVNFASIGRGAVECREMLVGELWPRGMARSVVKCW